MIQMIDKIARLAEDQDRNLPQIMTSLGVVFNLIWAFEPIDLDLDFAGP